MQYIPNRKINNNNNNNHQGSSQNKWRRKPYKQQHKKYTILIKILHQSTCKIYKARHDITDLLAVRNLVCEIN